MRRSEGDERPQLLIVGHEELCASLGEAVADTYRSVPAADLASATGHMERGEFAGVLIEADLVRSAPKSVRREVTWGEHDLPVILLTESREPIPFDLIREMNAYHALPYTERSWEYVARSIVDVLGQLDLERENQLLRKVTGVASDCIMAVDEGTHIHLVNGAVVRTFGYARAELLGQPMEKLFPRGAGQGDGGDIYDAIKAGELWWGEVIAQRRDGSRFPVHVALSFAHDLRVAVTFAVIVARDVTELQRLLGRLTQLSIVDDLTDVYNVRYFWARFRYEMLRSRRYEQELAVLMLDLDRFKRVNDRYGHQMGDKVLHHVASLMKGVTREVDIVSRYGGEEFAVILPNTGEEGAISCAENIRATVERTGLGVEGGELKVTLSVGVACLDADVRDEDDLLRRADAALRRAKAQGRNCVHLWHAEEEAASGQG